MKVGTLLNVLLGFGLAYHLARRWEKENAPPSWWEVRDREIAARRLQQLLDDPRGKALLTDAVAHPEKIGQLPRDLQDVALTLLLQKKEDRQSELGWWKLITICAQTIFGGLIFGTLASNWGLGPKAVILAFWLGAILGYMGINPFWQRSSDVSQESAHALTNINTASVEELQKLPGIGLIMA